MKSGVNMREVKPVYKEGTKKSHVVEIYPAFGETQTAVSKDFIEELKENTLFCNLDDDSSPVSSARSRAEDAVNSISVKKRGSPAMAIRSEKSSLLIRSDFSNTEVSVVSKERKPLDLQKKRERNECKRTERAVSDNAATKTNSMTEEPVESTDSIIVQFNNIDNLDIPKLSAEQMKQNILESHEELKIQKRRKRQIKYHRRGGKPYVVADRLSSIEFADTEPVAEPVAEPKIVVNDMSLSNVDNIDTAPVTDFPPPTDIIEPESEKRGLLHYLNLGAIWCISGLILFLFILVVQYMAESVL